MKNYYETGKIVKAGYRIDSEYPSPLLWLEIEEDNGWYCTLEFPVKRAIRVIKKIAPNRDICSLLERKVQLLPYPGVSHTMAPIAISSDPFSEWIFKKGYTEDGVKEDEKDI